MQGVLGEDRISVRRRLRGVLGAASRPGGFRGADPPLAESTVTARIERIVAYRVELPFVEGDYAISGGRVARGLDSTVVAIHTDTGDAGWGEMAPLGATYAPAFAGGARAALAELAPALVGLDARAPVAASLVMDRTLRGHPYAKSPLDIALWDLAARLAGLPLAALLGGRFGDTVDVYRALPIDEPEATSDLARVYVRQGYRRLQVKVGDDPADDLERVAATRLAVGDGVTLFADANGGWSTRDARRFLHGLRDDGVVVEQPCATIEECAAIRAACPRPIVLDESIDSLEALIKARDLGVADGITIKIARVGGITPARLIRDAAVSLRIPVTIEDTGGAEIDTAAIAQLALSTPEALRMHAYPFHELVTISNADGMPPVRDGRLTPPPGNGLGVEPRQDVLGEPILEFAG
jgi:cis-L-3-hydroxyproline dehydratase